MSNEDVLDCVKRLALALGVSSEPTVIADRSNLVLHLVPHPLVARVAMATSAARVGMAWLAREVELARFLGPTLCTTPASQLEAGPHSIDGYVVSFWKLEQLSSVQPALAGAQLAACHRALRAYPHERLPRLGFWDEVLALHPRITSTDSLSEKERTQLARSFEHAQRIVDGVQQRSAMQAVHGDAHLGNALGLASGGCLWTDWEDAFIGPIEYDLACLRSRRDLFGEDRQAIDEALTAYDLEHDASLLGDLALVRNVQVIVWLTLFAERQPELLPRVRARIAKLG